MTTCCEVNFVLFFWGLTTDYLHWVTAAAAAAAGKHLLTDVLGANGKLGTQV